MKSLSPGQIRVLAGFKSENLSTTSFYLDTDKSRQTKKAMDVSFKNLLNEGRTRLESMDRSRTRKQPLLQDLDKIGRFGKQSLPAWNASGLAIFACTGAKFWEELALPRAPRNHFIFDRSLYIRPLASLLDEYRHLCALLLDRQEARWYEVFLGEISLVDSLKSDVPSRVREGGWQGHESKRIERHIDAHLHDPFRSE